MTAKSFYVGTQTVSTNPDTALGRRAVFLAAASITALNITIGIRVKSSPAISDTTITPINPAIPTHYATGSMGGGGTETFSEEGPHSPTYPTYIHKPSKLPAVNPDSVKIAGPTG